ncbi:DUF5675 family protein, partial [uncultured Alistipes sp.]
YARTAIPAGTYKVTMQYSPRFRRVLPYLHDVLHFLGILIHSGNTEEVYTYERISFAQKHSMRF